TGGVVAILAPVNVGTGTVRVNATAGVAQAAAGVITAQNLAVVAKGSIDLCVPGSPNQVAGKVALDAGGGPAGSHVFFLDAPGFTVDAVAGDACAAGATGVTSNDGDVDLVSVAGPITLTQAVNTGAASTATVRLNSGGAVTQT